MAWQDELKQASFRGIPFKVDSADRAFGWSTSIKTTKTQPLTTKDGSTLQNAADADPFVEIGDKQPNQWNITAHFSGNDYLDARNAFIAAIEAGQSGVLQLPLEEPFTVLPMKGAVQYSNQAGGYESIRVQFVETTLKVQPTISTNTTRETSDSANTILESTEDDFALETGTASFVEEDTAGFVETLAAQISDSILGAVGSVSDYINGESSGSVLASGGVLSNIGDTTRSVGEVIDDITEAAIELSEDAADLIQTPSDLAGKINSIIDDLTFAFVNPINAFNAQLDLFTNYGAGLPFYSGSTTTEQGLQSNSDAMAQIVQNAALAGAGKAIALTNFDSIDEALEIKARFDEAVRTQQVNNGDLDGYENSYYALAELQASVANHIKQQERLPSNVELEFQEATPALVIAHDYYGDAERADEIVTRNNVRNPLFVQRDIVVLSE